MLVGKYKYVVLWQSRGIPTYLPTHLPTHLLSVVDVDVDVDRVSE